jgi:hypothetical protein
LSSLSLKLSAVTIKPTVNGDVNIIKNSQLRNGTSSQSSTPLKGSTPSIKFVTLQWCNIRAAHTYQLLCKELVRGQGQFACNVSF